MVTIANGGKHALYNVFMALLDPGDEVLIPAPYWVSYPETGQARGRASPRGAHEQGHRLPRRCRPARATPHRTDQGAGVRLAVQPHGRVYPADEVAAVGRWAAEHGIWVITDEIYQHLVYGDAEFVSLPVVAPEAAGRGRSWSAVSPRPTR